MNDECKNCGELFPSPRMLEIHQKYCKEDIGIPWNFETSFAMEVAGKPLELGRRIRKVKTRHQFEDRFWYYNKEKLQLHEVEKFPDELLRKLPDTHRSQTHETKIAVQLDESRWLIYYSEYFSSEYGEDSWTKHFYLVLNITDMTLQLWKAPKS